MAGEKEIIIWLQGLPAWQQEAAIRILTNRQLSDTDFDQLTAMCKAANDQTKANPITFPSLDTNVTDTNTLRLVSVGDIYGIENLKPRKPLVFGDNNLTVVYGHNGSGKSGYVRILKKARGKSGS